MTILGNFCTSPAQYQFISRSISPLFLTEKKNQESLRILGRKARPNRAHILMPILCNRCLVATVRSWPLAFQVWVLLQYIQARVRLGPSHRPRRNLGHCNQRCIHQPQSNHQSDLEPNIALLFFHSAPSTIQAFSNTTRLINCFFDFLIRSCKLG